MTWEHIILGLIILSAAIVTGKNLYNTATGKESPCGKSCGSNGDTCRINISNEEMKTEADDI